MLPETLQERFWRCVLTFLEGIRLDEDTPQAGIVCQGRELHAVAFAAGDAQSQAVVFGRGKAGRTAAGGRRNALQTMKTNNLISATALAAALWMGSRADGAGALASRELSDLRRDATVAAVEAVMPSVVNVATASVVPYSDFYDRLMRDFYGWGNSLPREQLNSIGSGVIIDEDGWVLTNLHVLRRASRVEVKLWNGEVYEADPVVATEFRDVALLKLRLPEGVKLKAVKFAEDEDLFLGETVLALGNPFGLGGTVTRGILSSKNRRPPEDDAPLDYQDWLQTDAAINPGNSGGPLINLEGELIGLNVAVYREGQGIGFAIPIKQVSEALSQFYTPEVSAALWFGARVKAVGDQLLVSYVQPHGPAAEAGLVEGQEIREVNGSVPGSLIEFNELVCSDEDQQVVVRTRQGGEEAVHKVRLQAFEDLISSRLGIAMVYLGNESDVRYRIRGQAGFYITEVERKGPGDQAGLRKGMLLTHLGDQEARNLLAIADAVSNTQPGDFLPVNVIERKRVGAGVYRFYRQATQVRVR